MKGIIGTKIGMTSVFGAEGAIVPCTVIQAGPCVVTQIKTLEKDGYESVQLGFGDKKEKNTTKALKGHFTKSNTAPKSKLVEFRGAVEGVNGAKVRVRGGAVVVDVCGSSADRFVACSLYS